MVFGEQGMALWWEQSPPTNLFFFARKVTKTGLGPGRGEKKIRRRAPQNSRMVPDLLPKFWIQGGETMDIDLNGPFYGQPWESVGEMSNCTVGLFQLRYRCSYWLLQSCKRNWVKIRFPEKVPWCNPRQLRPSPKPNLKMTNTLSLVPSPASTAVKRLLRRLLVLFGWDFIQQ